MDVVIIYMLGFGEKKEKSNGNVQLFSAGNITEAPKPPNLKSESLHGTFPIWQTILFWLVHFLSQFALTNCGHFF